MGDDIEKFFSKAFGTMEKAEEKVKDTLDPNKNGLASGIQGASGVLNQVMQNMLGVISPFVKVQNAAIDLAKAVGLAGKSIMSDSIRLIEQNRKMQLSASYGISNEQMKKTELAVMMGLGRNMRMEDTGIATPENPNFDSTFENVMAAGEMFGPERIAEIISGYDKLGISMKTAAKATGKLYKEAGEYGINLTKYTENFTSNLQMAQTYNFRNGVNGLKEMARKATEIRQDMKQIAAFADKVGTVTGAVETAANLQVLGGSFAALANPLTMLNKSLTDVNGLQDMFNGMTEGAATYNSTTHEIEMDPYTRMRMKRAAEAMGVDPNNFIDQAYAQARRTEITNQMNGVGGFGAEIEKLLPNIGEIDTETGAAGATIDGEFKTLAEIAADPELQNRLLETNVSESEDIKSILKSVMGIQKQVEGKGYQMENEQARNVITKGAINGQAPLDVAMDLVTKRIDETTSKAAGMLDKIILDFSAGVTDFKAAISTELIKPFKDFGNPEAFSTSFGQAAANILGEGARNIGAEFGQAFSEFANKVDNKFQEYGFSPMSGFRPGENEGRDGRAPLTPEDAAQARNSVALAARDVSIQATNFSLNGGENAQIQPIEGNGVSRASAAVQGDNNQIFGMIQAIASGLGYSITVPLAPAGDNGQTSTKITTAPESIPKTTVVPVGNTMQATLTDQKAEVRQNGNNEPYALNITGTLTMNVNGDNGKIGTVDIMKMLENNSTFRQELAKALADAYAKMDKSGLVSN